MGTNRRTSRLPVRWIAAAAALHLAAVALFLGIVARNGRPPGERPPVALAPEPPAPPGASPGVPFPATWSWAKTSIARLVAPPAAPRISGPPVRVRLAPRPGTTARPLLSSLREVRAFRAGKLPVDSTATRESALRQAALREATAGWNLAFLDLVPEAREEMFLRKLEDSPFPRR